MRTRVASEAIACVFVLLVLATAAAHAQTPPRRWELAVVFPLTRFVDLDPVVERDRQNRPDLRSFPLVAWWEPGVGVRVGRQITKRWSIETEVTSFDRYLENWQVTHGRGGLVATGEGKATFVFGPVVRKKFGRFALFGKARPGFAHFLGFPAIVGIAQGAHATLIASNVARSTFAALDLGGGMDLDLSRRIFVRFDLSDMMIHYRPVPRDLNPVYWRHSAQFATSAALRF